MDVKLKPLLRGAWVDHVSMVVRNRDRAVEMWSAFVAAPFQTLEYTNTALVFGKRSTYTLRMALAPLPGGIDLEVIELAKGEHAIHERFLAERGEGIQHIGYKVNDLQATIAAFREAGFQSILESERADAVSIYFDTTAVGGTITELIRKDFFLTSLIKDKG